MNKYEKLFRQILDQTHSGDLAWRQERRGAYADIIYNPQTVFRLYSADFSRKDNQFKLLLVEKKFDDPEQDFAYQAYAPQLLVIDDDELIATLTDSIIERRDFINLIDLVESNNDRANSLFD